MKHTESGDHMKSTQLFFLSKRSIRSFESRKSYRLHVSRLAMAAHGCVCVVHSFFMRISETIVIVWVFASSSELA